MAGMRTPQNPRTPLPGRPVRGSDTGRPIMALLDLLGRRWALRVLWELREDPAPTFRDLQQRTGGVSSSVLTDRLRELTEAGITERGEAGYRLTPRGRDLLACLAPLGNWAADWAAARAAGEDASPPANGNAGLPGASRPRSGASRPR